MGKGFQYGNKTFLIPARKCVSLVWGTVWSYFQLGAAGGKELSGSIKAEMTTVMMES